MDILISIHGCWIKDIISGKKPFEFRHNIPKNLKVGDTVYMYETYFNGGRKMVVGKFKVKSINPVKVDTRCPTYNFLSYYARHILKDEDAVKRIERAEKINLNHHYNDLVYKYIYSDEDMEYMETHNEPPEASFLKYSQKGYMDNLAKGESLSFDCDHWLYEIGLYNDGGETTYTHAIEIGEVEVFTDPIEITKFKCKTGKNLIKAPQSWCYIV